MNAEQLRDHAITQIDRSTPEWWKAEADRTIAKLAAGGTEFTTENVRAIVGDPPNHPNAMGARFLLAVRLGIIVKVGYRSPVRPSPHASVIAVWKGV